MSYKYILPGVSSTVPPERLPIPERVIGHYQPWIVATYQSEYSKASENMEEQVLKEIPQKISYSGASSKKIYISLSKNDSFKGYMLTVRFKGKESKAAYSNRVAPTGNEELIMIHI